MLHLRTNFCMRWHRFRMLPDFFHWHSGEEIDIEFLPAVKDAVNMSFSERNKLGFKMAMKKDLGFFFGLGSVAYAVSLSLSSMTGGGGIQLSSLLKCRPHMIFRMIQAKYRCKRRTGNYSQRIYSI